MQLQLQLQSQLSSSSLHTHLQRKGSSLGVAFALRLTRIGFLVLAVPFSPAFLPCIAALNQVRCALTLTLTLCFYARCQGRPLGALRYTVAVILLGTVASFRLFDGLLTCSYPLHYLSSLHFFHSLPFLVSTLTSISHLLTQVTFCIPYWAQPSRPFASRVTFSAQACILRLIGPQSPTTTHSHRITYITSNYASTILSFLYAQSDLHYPSRFSISMLKALTRL